MLHDINLATVDLQRTTKGPKAIERLRKRLSEQESLLLLMSPNMAFRVANRNGKVSLQRRDSSTFSGARNVDAGWGLERCCPLPVSIATLHRRKEGTSNLFSFLGLYISHLLGL